ncbi:hypothetical protein [Nostoc sp. FACHB-190]|uniref:hypothetical protein n=1 Tax=Nostoc sp. FACHB-190 TaxID=2692838 RepID=UPI0016860035|nr:hypothetical protein [Nostoc sp. FACHB-190]MBD2303619.1 hypothetical protein [Nostoc sp. FACHB-190]
MYQDFSKKAVACWYTWEDCYILDGKVDENKNLIIESELLLKNSSIEVVAAILADKRNVWTNYHPPLKQALNTCNQVDFDGQDSRDIQPLEDLFKCLKSENRLFLSREIKEANFANHSSCVKLLLKAFVNDLCGSNQGFSGSIATVIKRKDFRGRRRIFG